MIMSNLSAALHPIDDLILRGIEDFGTILTWSPPPLLHFFSEHAFCSQLLAVRWETTSLLTRIADPKSNGTFFLLLPHMIDPSTRSSLWSPRRSMKKRTKKLTNSYRYELYQSVPPSHSAGSCFVHGHSLQTLCSGALSCVPLRFNLQKC